MRCTSRMLGLFLAAALAVAAGCSPFELQTPDGFAELDADDTYDYRATSSDGVVLAVRSEANEPHGNLQFWSNALHNKLASAGYQRSDRSAVKTKSGLPGVRSSYRITHSGRPHVLWTAVFVHGDRVILVEAGGDVAHFRAVELAVERAIRSLDT